MTKHVFISGNVQGVGYRYFTRKNAEDLEIKGWVKNLPDGRVEAVFNGEPKKVREMLERSKHGPVTSKVRKIEEVTDISMSEEYSGFEVK